MSTPKVFQINDCDWWMAPTKEQAIADYRKEIESDPEYSEEVTELTDADLDRLKFNCRELSQKELAEVREQIQKFGADIDENNCIPFRAELQRLINLGKTSQFFASTEF